MASITFDGESTKEILKSISKIGSAFLIFGGAIILLSIYQNHILGLKIGLITLIFGSIFRLYNGVTRALMEAVEGKEYPLKYFTKITVIRFIIWFLLVIFYCYLINGILRIVII